LRAVDRTEIAVLVRPLVPDADPMLPEIGDVGVALQKPQQFVGDRLPVQPLRRQHRKAGGQIEAHLMAEDRAGSRAGPVGAVGPVV